MDDDREAYEFAYALHLDRQVDREAAQMIVRAAEAGLIGIERATEALNHLAQRYNRRSSRHSFALLIRSRRLLPCHAKVSVHVVQFAIR